MKTTNEVLAETGLTHPMLNRLKDLGIIPKPGLRGQGRGRGVIGVYEDDIIDIIKGVKRQQESGLSLTQIARKEQPTAELAVKTEPPVKAGQQGKIVAPGNPRLMSEYITATQGLFEQVARENPGQELHFPQVDLPDAHGPEYGFLFALDLPDAESPGFEKRANGELILAGDVVPEDDNHIPAQKQRRTVTLFLPAFFD